MLTIKYVDGDGVESLHECHSVIADRIASDTDRGKRRVLVFDETPTLSMDNHTGVYVDNGNRSAGGPLTGPAIFVMNRFGSTVAKYNL